MTDRPLEGAAAGLAPGSITAALTSPLAILAAAMLICAVLLTQPLVLPLGPMYWDLALYLDAANRIAAGQLPAIDFLTPVGPLGYWLFAWGSELFPQSQPLLMAQWSLFVVTAPPMALIVRQIDRQSRATALALLLPYLAFQILPVNVEHYSFFPGADGFGIYNRHVSIVLYVLVSALVFLRDRTLLGVVLVWTLLALLLIKITGFLAGGLVVATALAAGRIDPGQSLAVAAFSCLALLGLEFATGIVSAYVEGIAALLAINAGSILSRFLQAASLHLDIVAAGSALLVALVVLSRQAIAAAARAARREPSAEMFRRLLDRDVVWLGAVLAAGLFFETQNTGGQAFIFAWPVLLAITRDWLGRWRRGAVVVLGLVAATAIPPLETVLQRAGRAMLAQSGYVTVPGSHLGRLGLVSQHREVIERAAIMQNTYASDMATYRGIAENRILPSPGLYAELDFQAGWLMAVDAGIDEILAYEARHNVRFETIMSLNFANPFRALMDRTGVRHIAIGADPFRAVPPPDEDALASVAEADLIVKPNCPVTIANETLADIYRTAMSGHREIALGPCWTGYVRAR